MWYDSYLMCFFTVFLIFLVFDILSTSLLLFHVDASNVFDEEVVNANEIDYSDDEAEMAARRASSKKRHDNVPKQQDLITSTVSIPPSRKSNPMFNNYTSSQSPKSHGHTTTINTTATSSWPTSSTQQSYLPTQTSPASYWNYTFMPPPVQQPIPQVNIQMPTTVGSNVYPPYPPPPPTFFPPRQYGSYTHPPPTSMPSMSPGMYLTNFPYSPPETYLTYPQQSY